jgi:hypothetical protein
MGTLEKDSSLPKERKEVDRSSAGVLRRCREWEVGMRVKLFFLLHGVDCVMSS